MSDSSTSVLRRKLESKSTSSSGVKNMSALWSSMKKETLKTLGEALGRDITSANHTMGKVSHRKFAEQFDGPAPFYHLGSAMEAFSALIYFSPQLSAAITRKKLVSENDDSEEEAIAPGLLDLYLLQPLAQQLIDSMKRTFAAVTGPESRPEFSLRDQILSLEELKGIEDDNDLFQYTLSLPIDENGSEATIGYCFPYASLERMSLVSKNRFGAATMDRSDPWVGHMQSTVLQSKMPLRIVLESCRMTVGECTRLREGQVLELPGAALSDLMVKAQTKTGIVDIGRSALGIYKHNKAVKLSGALDTDFIMDLPNLMSG